MIENKLQWSCFFGPDRKEQVVVRADNMDEFKRLIEEIKLYTSLIPTTPAKPVPPEYSDVAEFVNEAMDVIAPRKPKKVFDEQTSTFAKDYCSIHDTPMYEKTGKLGPFWSHYRKLGDRYDNCSGKGYQSEQRPS